MNQTQPLIESACARIEHFENALSQYKTFFADNALFQKNFLSLVDALVQTERSAQTQSSKQVFLIAVGKSAGVARVAASMFVSVGIPVHFIHPTEAIHGDFGIVHKNDTVIFISNSGNSPELLQLIPRLSERNVAIYTITAKINSALALKSNFILQLPNVEEKCPLYQSPITSTVTSLALCQLLVAATVEARDFSLERYAQNHPGGAIGKRIFLKVDDIMRKGAELPIIAPNENFQNVVSVFTSYSKGCLLVVENEKFLGLIAERDVRKAMETFGSSVFQQTARDMMNSNPTTAQCGILAADALQVMTQKQPFFNVLPIVTEKNEAVGVVQLQELLALGL